LKPLPNIFSHTCYRGYLADCLRQLKLDGISARAFARTCGMSSPNFFRLIIDEKRNLTPLIAARVAGALGLTATEHEYLLALVKLAGSRTANAKNAALTKMRQLVQKAERQVVDDSTLHTSWTNALVWEMLKLREFNENTSKIKELLRNAATEGEIMASLEYFERKSLISKHSATSERPTQALVDFAPSNDVRRIDLQMSHLRFLQLAQHRLNDPLTEREYQGLTVAIKKESFAQVRELTREFIHRLNEQFAVDKDGDEVIRVQVCAFKLTKI
jgi:uncharacterized protein (TIGR02147 family)